MLLRQRLWLVAPAVLILACTGHQDPPSVIVPLSRGAAISNSESPAIAARVTFNNRSAWFVFDTGAGAHTLAAWFVDAADLKIDHGFDELSALDSGGNPVNLRVVRDQPGELLGGHTLSLPMAIVAGFPPEFEKAEIGGLLNPQLLASEGNAVVFDLKGSELRFEPFDRAVDRLNARRVSMDEMKICTSDDVAIPNRVFALLVEAGENEGWLTIDTGADVTSVTSVSSLSEGAVLEPGGQTMGIAGKPQSYQLAPALALGFSGHQASVNAHVVESRAGSCGADGLLGLDAMASCAFVFGEQELAIACDPVSDR